MIHGTQFVKRAKLKKNNKTDYKIFIPLLNYYYFLFKVYIPLYSKRKKILFRCKPFGLLLKM